MIRLSLLRAALVGLPEAVDASLESLTGGKGTVVGALQGRQERWA